MAARKWPSLRLYLLNAFLTVANLNVSHMESTLGSRGSTPTKSALGIQKLSYFNLSQFMTSSLPRLSTQTMLPLQNLQATMRASRSAARIQSRHNLIERRLITRLVRFRCCWMGRSNLESSTMTLSREGELFTTVSRGNLTSRTVSRLRSSRRGGAAEMRKPRLRQQDGNGKRERQRHGARLTWEQETRPLIGRCWKWPGL